MKHLILNDEKTNYKLYPIFSKRKNRNYNDIILNDIENNCLVMTDGKVLLRVEKNEMENKLYNDKKIIYIHTGKGRDRYFPEYKKVIQDDNDKSFEYDLSSAEFLKAIKKIEKAGKAKIKELKNEKMSHNEKQENVKWQFVNNDLAIYFENDLPKLYTYEEKNIETKYYIKNFIDVFTTLHNCRDSQGNMIFTDLNTDKPLKISNENFTALIMPVHP